MMWLPNPLSLYHKEGFLVSKDFYSTASSGGLFALKLTIIPCSENGTGDFPVSYEVCLPFKLFKLFLGSFGNILKGKGNTEIFIFRDTKLSEP